MRPTISITIIVSFRYLFIPIVINAEILFKLHISHGVADAAAEYKNINTKRRKKRRGKKRFHGDLNSGIAGVKVRDDNHYTTELPDKGECSQTYVILPLLDRDTLSFLSLH